MTVEQALQLAVTTGPGLRRLERLERLDAGMLLLHALGRDPHERAWLLAHGTDELAPSALQNFQSLCAQRQDGMPMAYLLGRTEFYGLPLTITPEVLDPRDDTETLVDWALSLMPPDAALAVVDLGTGSGAIALALRHERPAAQVWAVDQSPAALAVARRNAEVLGLPVRWLEGNWLSSMPADQRFDLIVSNPPYIAATDPHMPALRHEPRQALVSGLDGLDDIRTLVDQAPGHLKPGGWLLLEHGHDQSAAVQALLRQAGFDQVQSRPDLAGIPRCTGGHWPGVK
jgi:release factor glutamine methyltransferase